LRAPPRREIIGRPSLLFLPTEAGGSRSVDPPSSGRDSNCIRLVTGNPVAIRGSIVAAGEMNKRKPPGAIYKS
jgi:hypothetical protein